MRRVHRRTLASVASIWGASGLCGSTNSSVRLSRASLNASHSLTRTGATATSLMCCGRRYLHTTRDDGHPDADGQEETLAVVEVLGPEDLETQSEPRWQALCEPSVPRAFASVTALDTFSRARVINFLKRHSKHAPEVKLDPFETEVIDGDRFHCRLWLPLELPASLSSSTQALVARDNDRERGARASASGTTDVKGIWAHGVAPDRKQAEHLAAMHAEYIIDALGHHIYTLSSKQRKHAMAAHKAGRPAPMPDGNRDGVFEQETRLLPLPLQLRTDSDGTEDGQWQLVDIEQSGRYAALSPPHTLLSPAVFDRASQRRMEAFMQSVGHTFVQNCVVLRETPVHVTGVTGDAAGRPFFTAELRIPRDVLGDTHDGTGEALLVTKGKALKREDAIVLASMHAELLLDACGICLFPEQPHRQKAHAQAAWSFGRPAPLPDATPKDPSHVLLPPSLKQRIVAHDNDTGNAEASVRSAEEECVHRHRILTAQTTTFVDTSIKEETAVAQLKAYLAAQRDPRAADPFFRESILGKVKSSVVLPVPVAHGICGGIGIASTAGDADVLAAMHALDTLCALGISAQQGGSPDSDARWKAHRHRVLRESGGDREAQGGEGQKPTLALRPPGRRLAPGGFVQCVQVPFTVDDSATQHETAEAATVSPRRVAKRVKVTPVVESCQPTNNADMHTALTPDTEDGFVLVSVSGAGEAATQLRSALAIDSPRVLDPLAKDRVVEYLSTVGRRFNDVFTTTRRQQSHGDPETDDLYECAGVIPVPAAFGDRIGLGVAPSRAQAESLAAMHVELTLDALGVRLFADTVKQQAHAEACRQAGRWAPSPRTDKAQPHNTPSPPPLRLGDVLRHDDVAHQCSADQAPQTAGPQQSTDGPTVSTSHVSDTVTDVIERDLDPVAKSRVLYYLARLKQPLPTVTLSVSFARGVILHTASWRLPLPASTDTSSEVSPARSARHVLVSGTAPTKRDADVLSWMHAERALDSLGVPVFANLPRYQAWHATRVAALGRTAPGMTTSDNHASRMTQLSPPPPLRLVPTPSVTTPTAPVLPRTGTAPEEAANWAAYIKSCTEYVAQKALIDANLFFDAERVPRCGQPVIDATLAEVEARPVDPHAKLILQLYCHTAKVDYPRHWHCVMVGPLDHRVSYATIAVPGFLAVTAHGVGASRETAQKRAAMHALALLPLLDPDFAERDAEMQEAKHEVLASAADEGDAVAALASSQASLLEALHQEAADLRQASPPTLLAARKQRKAGGRRTEKDPDPEEQLDAVKRRVVELYTICADLPPPKVTHFVERQAQRGVDGDDTAHSALSPPAYSTVVSVLRNDDDGSKPSVDAVWSGQASGRGPRANEHAAFGRLYSALIASVPMVATLEEVIQRNPLLIPSRLPSLVMHKQQRDAVLALAAAAKENAERRVAATSRNAPADGAGGDAASQSAPVEEATNVLRAALEMTHAQQDLESVALQEQYFQKIINPAYSSQYGLRRDALSIAKHKEHILCLIENNPVVVICGTTGCGKTTQVPQYILDAATERGDGGSCAIVVTQPRRISALSIAARVAAERLEAVGDNCGYIIRFDAKPGRHINFCTSGIVMRMLSSSADLSGIQYLIIDEIHERDLISDFLLVVLRDVLARRKDLRVILMSATLQAEQFGEYFHGAPIVNVEGYAHPVQELYLEDVAELAEKSGTATPLVREALRAQQRQKSRRDLLSVGDDEAEQEDDDVDDPHRQRLRSDAQLTATASLGTGLDAGVRQKYAVVEATSEIDYVILQCAVEQGIRMVDNIQQSSVLVFLPGWEEIQKAKEIMERDTRYQIIPLHSSVSPSDQMRCFLPAEDGKIKVVLATNIAESGITIDDVAVVVDLGRVKEKTFMRLGTDARQQGADIDDSRWATNAGEAGPEAMASKLMTVYASRANCIQRRGRVGRTRPGVCIRLFSRGHFASLHEFQTPEMQRTPLDALCLNVLALGLPDPVTFLAGAMEPPRQDAIESAMHRLSTLGAITASSRTLTALGVRLAQLPLEPRLGKLVLLGTAFRCLDAALTMAATAAGSDVFKPGREHRASVRLYREDFSRDTLSDDIANLNAYNFWVSVHQANTAAEVAAQLHARMLSLTLLVSASQQKHQFFSILAKTGVLHQGVVGEAMAVSQLNRNALMFVDSSPYSENSLDVALVQSIIAAAFSPCIAVQTGAKSFRTKHSHTVSVSPDSVLAKTPDDATMEPFFVYHEALQTAERRRLSVQGLSSASIWSLVLFASRERALAHDAFTGLATLDGWLLFHMSPATFRSLMTLRETIADALDAFYVDPLDTANAGLLAQLWELIRSLVGAPLRPNLLSDTTWCHTGRILAPIATPIAKRAPRSGKETTDTASPSDV